MSPLPLTRRLERGHEGIEPMTTVRLDSFHLMLPEKDDCWYLDAPHEVVIKRLPPTALGQAPLYTMAQWTGLKEAPLGYATAETVEVIEPSDDYTRVGINARDAWNETKGEGVKVVILDKWCRFQASEPGFEYQPARRTGLRSRQQRAVAYEAWSDIQPFQRSWHGLRRHRRRGPSGGGSGRGRGATSYARADPDLNQLRDRFAD